MSVSKSYWNSLDYASTSNTREVMKVYNPKTLKDFTQQHVAQMAPYPNQRSLLLQAKVISSGGVGQ